LAGTRRSKGLKQPSVSAGAPHSLSAIGMPVPYQVSLIDSRDQIETNPVGEVRGLQAGSPPFLPSASESLGRHGDPHLHLPAEGSSPAIRALRFPLPGCQSAAPRSFPRRLDARVACQSPLCSIETRRNKLAILGVDQGKDLLNLLATTSDEFLHNPANVLMCPLVTEYLAPSTSSRAPS